MPRVFISVAEDSADVHAASLLRAAVVRLPDCRFYGLTGPRMRAAGADTLADLTSHAAMLAGVGGVFRRALAVVKQVEESWRREPPDLIVLLDSPELHLGIYELGILGLAGRAKKLGLPVLYYIAPQTWAARAGRNAWIRRDVDRLACILPFEPEYFRGHGIAAEYVGHPLFEALRSNAPSSDVSLQSGLPTARLAPSEVRNPASIPRPLVALLPGSRRHVIATMLPLQLEVVRALRACGVDVSVAVSCVSAERQEHIAGIVPRDAAIVTANNAALLSAADLVLVASGTATLEVAHYRKPMIVMYDAGALMAWLHPLVGRRILTTPHLSLVNILAGSRVVPEFMPFVRDPAQIARVAAELLTDEAWRRLMGSQIDDLLRPLEASRASESVCGLISQMLSRRSILHSVGAPTQ